MKKYSLFLIAVLSIQTVCFSQTTFTSSNLPIVVIDTRGVEIPNEPKIEATMGIIDNGSGNRNNLTDPFNGYNGKIGIEIRGQSSTMFDKKQYGIETRNSGGEDSTASLLGLPAESDWVLNANYLDKTFMRNILAYKLFNDFGRYATRTRFCEVVLNGKYIGLYILQEKIKRDKNRVNISKLEPEEITGDDLTGGYIVRIDKIDSGDQYWTSPFLPYSGSYARVLYQYYYPDGTDIVSEQKKYIKDYVTAFETLMNSSSYNDPFANYLDYIDIDSFVDMFLLNEFTKSTDAYRISAYFHKNVDSKGGKLVAGPPWDFDIAFGVADYDNGYDPSGWQALYKNYTSMENPFWCRKLFNDPIFKNKFIKRWNELKNNVLSTTTINKYIDDTILEINEAVTRNFNKWNILGSYVWPNKYTFSTYAAEINYLKSWIKQRSSWIDSQLPETSSNVEWCEHSDSDIYLVAHSAFGFPKSFFVKSSQNVSLIEFYCSDQKAILNERNDSLFITFTTQSECVIRGVAKNNGETVSISPEYKVHVATDVESEKRLPSSFVLFQNYPNPFNPSTVISYELPQASCVTLKIYDMLGREVSTLVSELESAGKHQIKFYAEELGGGIYFYKLIAGEFSKTAKMLLLK
jgi:hypothetical protein